MPECRIISQAIPPPLSPEIRFFPGSWIFFDKLRQAGIAFLQKLIKAIAPRRDGPSADSCLRRYNIAAFQAPKSAPSKNHQHTSAVLNCPATTLGPGGRSLKHHDKTENRNRSGPQRHSFLHMRMAHLPKSAKRICCRHDRRMECCGFIPV